MGTRSRAFIAVSPGANPNLAASWIRRINAEVTTDQRGTLLQFDENLKPLAFRIPETPGDASVLDLVTEIEIYEWLAAIGTRRFRFVRGDERLEQAGQLPSTPWFDDDTVRDLEHQVLTELGPEYTGARHADFAHRLSFQQFKRTGRDVDDLLRLPGTRTKEAAEGPSGARPGRAYGGTRDLEAQLHLVASGPYWQADPTSGEDSDLETAERKLYRAYESLVAESRANSLA